MGIQYDRSKTIFLNRLIYFKNLYPILTFSLKMWEFFFFGRLKIIAFATCVENNTTIYGTN